MMLAVLVGDAGWLPFTPYGEEAIGCFPSPLQLAGISSIADAFVVQSAQSVQSSELVRYTANRWDISMAAPALQMFWL
jgi:hypothetical protein